MEINKVKEMGSEISRIVMGFVSDIEQNTQNILDICHNAHVHDPFNVDLNCLNMDLHGFILNGIAYKEDAWTQMLRNVVLKIYDENASNSDNIEKLILCLPMVMNEQDYIKKYNDNGEENIKSKKLQKQRMVKLPNDMYFSINLSNRDVMRYMQKIVLGMAMKNNAILIAYNIPCTIT